MNLKDISSFLQENGYMIKEKDNYILTGKFHREIDTVSIVKVNIKKLTNKEIYKQFIKHAEVPYRLPLNNGRYYTVSAYSEKAMKIFTKIKDDPTIDNTVFLMSTKLFYTSNSSNKPTITNYITQGMWETHYEALVEQIKENQGDIQSYIKEQTTEGERFFEKGI